jgi:hypothetical protein
MPVAAVLPCRLLRHPSHRANPYPRRSVIVLGRSHIIPGLHETALARSGIADPLHDSARGGSVVVDPVSAIVRRRSVAIFISPSSYATGHRRFRRARRHPRAVTRRLRAVSAHARAARRGVRWLTLFIALHVFVCAQRPTNVTVPIRNPGCQSSSWGCTTQKISCTRACTGCASPSAARA